MTYKDSIVESAYKVLISEDHMKGSKIIALGKMGTIIKQVGQDGNTEGDEIYKVKFEDGSVEEISAREMEMQGDENRKPSENEIEDLVKEDKKKESTSETMARVKALAMKAALGVKAETEKKQGKNESLELHEAAALAGRVLSRLAFAGRGLAKGAGDAARATPKYLGTAKKNVQATAATALRGGQRIANAPIISPIVRNLVTGRSAHAAAKGHVGWAAKPFNLAANAPIGVQRWTNLTRSGRAAAIKSGRKVVQKDSKWAQLRHRAGTTAYGRAVRAAGRTVAAPFKVGKSSWKHGYTSPVNPAKPGGPRSFDPMKAYVTTDIARSVHGSLFPAKQPKPPVQSKPIVPQAPTQYQATVGGQGSLTPQSRFGFQQ